MVRAGSRSVISYLDERLAAEVSATLGREVSGAAVRRHRDYGALATERVPEGDRRTWRFVAGTTALVAELEMLKSGRLSQHKAVLVTLIRQRPLHDRGVRRAYREFFKHQLRTLQRWGANTDIEEASEQATSALLRTYPGRQLRAAAMKAWRNEAPSSTRDGVLSRTRWVGQALHDAGVESIAVAAGRARDLHHSGRLLHLLHMAAGGLPGSELLDTIADPGAVAVLTLLDVQSLAERTQQAPYEELLLVARSVYENALWGEGRDLAHAMIDTFYPGQEHADVRVDLLLASIFVPSLLIARARTVDGSAAHA